MIRTLLGNEPDLHRNPGIAHGHQEIRSLEVTFDSLSAERLRQFTSDAVGRRIVVSVNQRRLATLRLLDPIVEGRILLTGDFDGFATEALFSAGAVLNLEVERSEPGR